MADNINLNVNSNVKGSEDVKELKKDLRELGNEAERAGGTLKRFPNSVPGLKGVSSSAVKMQEELRGILKEVAHLETAFKKKITTSGIEGLKNDLQDAQRVLTRLKDSAQQGVALGGMLGNDPISGNPVFDTSDLKQKIATTKQWETVVKGMEKAEKTAAAAMEKRAQATSDVSGATEKNARDSARASADSARSTRSLGSAFGTLKGAVKSIDYPFKSLISSLKRIAKLRLLRGIIRGITGAFSEGKQNIYQYSLALNGLDASNVSGSLNEMRANFLYMKNAVAAAVAPLIQALVPVLQTVTNWFVTAASAVAQFFAAINGQTSFTKAKKSYSGITDGLGGVADAAGGATAAVKEYENTIMGFDEIHALNDVNDSGRGGGGGGGGGAATPDYSSMFEEVPINMEWAKKVKKAFEDILDIVKSIGAAMLAWKIGSMVSGFIDKLADANLISKGIADKLKGGIRIAVGLIVAIAGVTLAYKGGYDIGYNGPSLLGIIKAGIGVMLAGAGGAMVGSGISMVTGGAVAAASATGIGFVIGIAIGAVATFIGIEIGKYDKLMDTTWHLTDEYKNLEKQIVILDGVMANNGAYADATKQIYDNLATKLSQIDQARYLIGWIDELNGKQDASGTYTEELKTSMDALNQLGLDGINAEWDDLTQTVKLDKQGLLDHLATMEQVAKEEAYLEVMKEAWKAQAQAVVDSKKAEEAYVQATQGTNDAIATAREYLEKYYGAVGLTNDEVIQMTNQLSTADKNMAIMGKAISDNIGLQQKSQDAWKKEQQHLTAVNKDLKTTKVAYYDLTGQTEKMKAAQKEVVDEFNGSTKPLKELTKNIEGGSKGIKAYGGDLQYASKRARTAKQNWQENVIDTLRDVGVVSKHSGGQLGKFGEEVDKVNKKEYTGKSVTSGLSDVISKSGLTKNGIWDVIKRITGLNEKKFDGSKVTPGLKDVTEKSKDAKGKVDLFAQGIDTVNGKTFPGTKISKGFGEVSGKARGAKDNVNGASDAVTNIGKKKYNGRNISDGLWGISGAGKDASGKVWGADGAVASIIGRAWYNGRNVSDGLWNIQSAGSNANTSISNLLYNLGELGRAPWRFSVQQKVDSGYTYNVPLPLIGWKGENGGFVPGFASGGVIPAYAQGGINSASLFMAHENGAPELVGRLGNHTAVANTSQMVDAMARGVYQAMSQVMANDNGQTEVNVYMDGRKVAQAVDKANRTRNRRFNVSM